MKLDENAGKCLVFYDSNCGLCDNFIRILAKLDKADSLRFAPLNGYESKKNGIQLANDPKKWSIIVFDEGITYEKSNAILKIFSKIPQLSKAGLFLKVFPPSVRDKGYEIFARWRHVVLQNQKNCRFDPLIKYKFLP